MLHYASTKYQNFAFNDTRQNVTSTNPTSESILGITLESGIYIFPGTELTTSITFPSAVSLLSESLL